MIREKLIQIKQYESEKKILGIESEHADLPSYIKAHDIMDDYLEKQLSEWETRMRSGKPAKNLTEVIENKTEPKTPSNPEDQKCQKEGCENSTYSRKTKKAYPYCFTHK